MSLKAVVDSLEGLPEVLHEFYQEQDGKFILSAEGMVPKAKIDEFRENNIKLLKEKERWEQKLKTEKEEWEKHQKELSSKLDQYQEIDIEKAKEALQKVQGIEENQLIEKGDIDELVEQRIQRRIKSMQDEHSNQVQILTDRANNSEGEVQSLLDELANVIIERKIVDAVTKVGVLHQGAMGDVLSRGKMVWKLDDNRKPVALDGEGNPIYGNDGTSRLSFEEWARSLAKDAGYLFKSSSGGGAQGSGGSESSTATNPWKKDSFNLTEQGRLVREEPKVAQRLMAEAGAV